MSVHIFPQKLKKTFNTPIIDLILLFPHIFFSPLKSFIQVILSLALFLENSPLISFLTGQHGVVISLFFIRRETSQRGCKFDQMPELKLSVFIFSFLRLSSRFVFEGRQHIPIWKMTKIELSQRIFAVDGWSLKTISLTLRFSGRIAFNFYHIETQFFHAFWWIFLPGLIICLQKGFNSCLCLIPSIVIFLNYF